MMMMMMIIIIIITVVDTPVVLLRDDGDGTGEDQVANHHMQRPRIDRSSAASKRSSNAYASPPFRPWASFPWESSSWPPTSRPWTSSRTSPSSARIRTSPISTSALAPNWAPPEAPSDPPASSSSILTESGRRRSNSPTPNGLSSPTSTVVWSRSSTRNLDRSVSDGSRLRPFVLSLSLSRLKTGNIHIGHAPWSLELESWCHIISTTTV